MLGASLIFCLIASAVYAENELVPSRGVQFPRQLTPRSEFSTIDDVYGTGSNFGGYRLVRDVSGYQSDYPSMVVPPHNLFIRDAYYHQHHEPSHHGHHNTHGYGSPHHQPHHGHHGHHGHHDHDRRSVDDMLEETDLVRQIRDLSDLSPATVDYESMLTPNLNRVLRHSYEHHHHHHHHVPEHHHHHMPHHHHGGYGYGYDRRRSIDDTLIGADSDASSTLLSRPTRYLTLPGYEYPGMVQIGGFAGL